MEKNDITKELLETINCVDEELTQIFYELLSDNVSLNKRILLRDKTLLLVKKAYDSIILSTLKVEEKVNLIKKEKEKNNKLSYISLIVRLSGFCFLFFNPILFFIIQMIGIIMNHISIKKNQELNDIDLEPSSYLVDKIHNLIILIGNCSRRLSLDIDVSNEKNNDLLFEKMDKANNIIKEYISTNNLPNDIDEVTKDILIKMLKKDLKIETNDIKVLLEEVRKKLNEEKVCKKLVR